MWKLRPTIARIVTVSALLLTGACGTDAPTGAGDAVGPLRVVATTTIVGDVVRNVGGDAIDLEVLLPPDSDPHAFQASPRDLVMISEADIVFVNGLGLESFLEPMLASSAGPDRVVSVSDGVDTIPTDGDPDHGVGDASEARADPHVWLDPANVVVWTESVASELAARDPARAEVYRANADAYRARLGDLDRWIQRRVDEVPPERRVLVLDHRAFAYFARRYGFDDVGTIFPSTSTLSEPSAGELAALERRIEELGVPAVFVSTAVDPRLAERVADDTGARLVRLYIGALSAPDGEAPTYDDLMRYDVGAIVDALR